jgi:hypothetical protein
MDSTLKIMQEKLATTERDIEELLFKRKANIQYSSQNDATLNQVLNLIDPSDKGVDAMPILDVVTLPLFSSSICSDLSVHLLIIVTSTFTPDHDARYSI